MRLKNLKFWIHRTFRYNRWAYRLVGCSHPVHTSSTKWGEITFCSRCGSVDVPQCCGSAVKS